MNDLIAKLEAATEGSRELDLRISYEINPPRYAITAEPVELDVWLAEGGARSYTTSLDAALTLVPEGWRWTVANPGYDKGVYQGGRALADLHHPLSSGGGPNAKAFGATPALALCIAALRARAA